MVYRIMDVNRDGETVARISSNNGKNALKKFRREFCTASGVYEIRRGKFNWSMFSSFGGAFYALPEKESGGNYNGK